MAHITASNVLESTTTTGTGALTLAGALTGARSFASAMAAADTCWYRLWAVDGNGNATGDFEEGLGTFNTTLARTAVLVSSNANALVNFGAGTKYVAIGLLAARTLQLDNVLACLLPAATAEPPTPAAQSLYLYARELLPGHTVLKVKRPSGIDSPLQDSAAFNRIVKCSGSNNAVNTFGAANLTFAGTASAVTPSSGSAKSQIQRVQYASAATAGALTSFVAPNAGACPVFRGGVVGEGGFRFVLRFSLQALQTGNRFFAGLAASVTAATGAAFDPTTTAAPARIGLGFNASTGNWQLIRGDGAAAPTVLDLGANFPLNTTDLIELVFFVRPHNGTSAGDLNYRVRRYTTNSDSPAQETSGTLSTNLPAATTLLHPYGFFSNNATAAAVSWQFTSLAIESDF